MKAYRENIIVLCTYTYSTHINEIKTGNYVLTMKLTLYINLCISHESHIVKAIISILIVSHHCHINFEEAALN